MTRLTFHGDPLLKARYVERLRDHVAAGDFRFAPVWEDGKGSALGCTIETDDVALYAGTLGYPDALAMVLDVLVNFRPAHPDARHSTDFAVRWLAGTPVGVDLSPVAGEVLCEMLDLPPMRETAVGEPAIETVRQAVIGLHRSALAGTPPSRSRWRAVRREALHVTDHATDDIARLTASVVEAAAWPHTTRTVLSDTLDALSRMVSGKAMLEIGWTSDREEAVFAMFEIISREAVGEPPIGDALLAEVARRSPALAAHFATRCEAMAIAQMVYTRTGDSVLRHFANG